MRLALIQAPILVSFSTSTNKKTTSDLYMWSQLVISKLVKSRQMLIVIAQIQQDYFKLQVQVQIPILVSSNTSTKN